MNKKRYNWFRNVFFIFIIITLFTIVDFLIHSLIDKSFDWYVPSYYYINKIIFGFIFGVFVLITLNNIKIKYKSLYFSIFISIILQLRYLFTGYEKSFVISYLFIHFTILYSITLLFNINKKLFTK